MPQQPSDGGDDLGASDEIIPFKDEGEQEEKSSESVSGSTDQLNDIKSSLVNEGESSQSNSNSEGGKQLVPAQNYGGSSKDRGSKKVSSTVGGNNDHHHTTKAAGFGPIPLLHGDLHVPYPPNGSMVPSSMANKVSVVHPPGAHPNPLAQLTLMYNNDHFPHGTTPPPHLAPPGSPMELDPKTVGSLSFLGMPRPRHPGEMPLYPPLPGQMGQLPHPMEVYTQVQWPAGTPVYPMTTAAFRGPYPTALTVNTANMPRFSHPGMPPHPGLSVTGIPHPAIVTPGAKQDLQQQSNDRQKEKNQKKAPHVKKPLNAFMLYMKEMRAKVVAECTLKESAAINQILGRRWHALSREEQAKYYELARKERQLHMQLYPGWSARDNYAVGGKKKKRKRDKAQGDNTEASNPKKCRARFGLDQQQHWCKPCRRKKKCIRYICGSDGSSENQDMDPNSPAMSDSPQHDDERSPLSMSDSPPGPPSPSHSNSSHTSQAKKALDLTATTQTVTQDSSQSTVSTGSQTLPQDLSTTSRVETLSST
ncbi:transcription factor 7-like 2 [Glandiceps talaboti]